MRKKKFIPAARFDILTPLYDFGCKMLGLGQNYRKKTIQRFSWFSVLFEEGLDNFKGNLPAMLSKAGFRNVEKINEYRWNIYFLKAEK